MAPLICHTTESHLLSQSSHSCKAKGGRNLSVVDEAPLHTLIAPFPPSVGLTDALSRLGVTDGPSLGASHVRVTGLTSAADQTVTVFSASVTLKSFGSFFARTLPGKWIAELVR